MENGKSLINLGELSKPATVLIEKVSDLIGGCFRPYQIKRVAHAEAEAEKIKALSQIEITELQHRALCRFLAEEAKKQGNIESITSKALPLLEDDSKPQDVDEDWITNFFDKCRLVSDEEMQTLWAKVLAGEANSPGRYSKRTVNFLGSLDKSDAALFTILCGFCWFYEDFVPLVFDFMASIYEAHGINFNVLKHMDDIGLLGLETVVELKRIRFPKKIRFFYHGTPIDIEFPKDEDIELLIGKVLLSKIGQELAPICGAKPIPGFLDYVITLWLGEGLILSSPYTRPNDDNA